MISEYKPVRWSRNKIGEVFGRLTLKSIVAKNGRSCGVCDCSCGTKDYITRMDVLRKGDCQSCGCIVKEMFTTHGFSQHPLYLRWRDMMQRCYSPTAKGWENYGGRGVEVCERWHDIRNFIADMGPTYEVGLLLDRQDNDKGYAPDNCRWVKWDVQSANKRHVVLIEHNGRKQILKLWCQEYGIRYVTAKSRINKGWDPVLAFTTPVDPKAPNARPLA